MTTSFSVNENNDVYIGNDGLLSISTGLKAVLFGCEHAVQAQMGEMMFEADSGVPTLEVAWGGSPSIIATEAELRKAILSVDNVIEVSELDAIITNNVLRYTATIKTIYGTGAISGL